MHTRKLVTIVTESVVEDRITKELEQLGATGFTITDARGKGDRGVRDAHHDFAANIRVEVVCSADVADEIAQHLVDKYFENYAIIWFISDVSVFRSGKFS